MSADTPVGNGDIVHTRELFEMERRIKRHIDSCFDHLDEKYVLRAACRERHRYIDPRQIWGAVATLAVIVPIVTRLLI